MSKINNYALEKLFTDTYKKYKNEPIAIKEAMCLKAIYPSILKPIEPGDLFAGRIAYPAVGFGIDEGGLGYYCNYELLERELYNECLPKSVKDDLREIIDFWKEEKTTRERVKAAYPKGLQKALPYENHEKDPAIAVPLYRMTGGYLDFDKLLTLGIPGMTNLIESRKEKALSNNEDITLFDGMLLALKTLKDMCYYYADMALNQERQEASAERCSELLAIALALRNVANHKPKTMREAMQLSWLYALISGAIEYGRMDEYLGDFYIRDLENSILDENSALSLTQGLWRLIAARKNIFHGRVVIGGLGRRNEENADRFAFLAIEATRTVLETEPQLSLRIYKGMNEKLYEKALDCIGQGRTYPMLYNDDINISAISKAFDISLEEATGYVPFGCGEYVINHKSFGTPNGVINMVKALEATLFNGIDPESGVEYGLKLGEFKNFNSFEEFFEAYKKQVEYYVNMLAAQEAIEYEVMGENTSCLYLSMLYDDCIDRGKAIFSGGIRHLGGTLETYGNINTSDSLTAIKELVYDKKFISPNTLLKALASNFAGYEKERQLMLKAPKYGNDNEEADTMAVKVHNHICSAVRKQKHNTSLDSYLAVLINNSANTIIGNLTGASPDGRKSRDAFANANNPSGGNDKNGITALLNSLVKLSPNIHAGAVQNMKFSKELFNKNRAALKSLLEVYFRNGGTQAMITVINKNDLDNAMKEPEKYGHIFVRVGGFSARFTNLSKNVQQEIISRTIY